MGDQPLSTGAKMEYYSEGEICKIPQQLLREFSNLLINVVLYCLSSSCSPDGLNNYSVDQLSVNTFLECF